VVSCVIGSQDVWNNGYVLNSIAVTNLGSQTITSWSVTLQFAEPTTIVNGWNVQTTLTGGGTVLNAVNLSYNGTLAPGQSVTFGFQGTHDGSFVVPTCSGN
jgi:cellulase/cellobiase CelA1